jgi:hypothetical protein
LVCEGLMEAFLRKLIIARFEVVTEVLMAMAVFHSEFRKSVCT